MDYETFLEEQKRAELLTQEEQKAFYAGVLEQETEKTKVRLLATFCCARLFYYEGNFEKTREILEPLLLDYQSYEYTQELLSCFNLMGVLGHCEGEFALTQYFYQKALEEARSHGQTEFYSYEYNNMAATAIGEQEYDKALEHILLAEKYLPESDEEMGAYVYVNQAIIYHHINRLEEAEKAYRRAMEEYRAEKYLPDDALICGAALHYKRKDTAEYMKYREKVIARMDEMHASEFMDACTTLFDCGIDSDDEALVELVLSKMSAYILSHPREKRVGVKIEDLKYQAAKWHGDKDGMLQALEQKNRYYKELMELSTRQRARSFERYFTVNGDLQTSLKNEARANRAKTLFLANMSHDIRTPMNAIVGITDLMEYALADPEKLKNYLHKIRFSSRHMMGLINDLLDMTQIESGSSKLNAEAFNLAEQTEQIDEIIRPQAEKKNQRFEIRVNHIRHENLIGDAVRLRQVILNMLTNAVKYTQRNGKLRLEIEELECSVASRAQYRFVVTDNGMGMDRKLLDHIFEPFTRGEDSVVNKIQGTGLGMAITRSIVDKMGGMIRIDSAPGEGSCVEVTLGFKIDRETDEKMEPMRVLLLSDDARIAQNLTESAKEKPIELFCCEKQDEAEKILQEEKAELVLLYGKPSRTARQLRCAARHPILMFELEDDGDPELEQTKNSSLDGVFLRPFFFTNLEKRRNRLRSSGADTGAEKSVLEGMRFLCAEDNALNAEILTAMLEITGASGRVCRDGAELVEAFQTVKPGEYDAILMDVQMPNLNGYDAARAVRNSKNPLGKQIPIIAMTANAFSDDVRHSIEAGMNAHLSKPIDVAQLEKTMRSILENEK